MYCAAFYLDEFSHFYLLTHTQERKESIPPFIYALFILKRIFFDWRLIMYICSGSSLLFCRPLLFQDVHFFILRQELEYSLVIMCHETCIIRCNVHGRYNIIGYAFWVKLFAMYFNTMCDFVAAWKTKRSQKWRRQLGLHHIYEWVYYPFI